MLAGHASGCWLSELGAGMPYNREKNEIQRLKKTVKNKKNKNSQISLKNVGFWLQKLILFGDFWPQKSPKRINFWPQKSQKRSGEPISNNCTRPCLDARNITSYPSICILRLPSGSFESFHEERQLQMLRLK